MCSDSELFKGISFMELLLVYAVYGPSARVNGAGAITGQIVRSRAYSYITRGLSWTPSD